MVDWTLFIMISLDFEFPIFCTNPSFIKLLSLNNLYLIIYFSLYYYFLIFMLPHFIFCNIERKNWKRVSNLKLNSAAFIANIFGLYMEANIHQSVKKKIHQCSITDKLLWEKRECRITKFYSILENGLYQFNYLFWRKSCACPTDLWYNSDCWVFSTGKVEQVATKLNDQEIKVQPKTNLKHICKWSFKQSNQKVEVKKLKYFIKITKTIQEFSMCKAVKNQA